MTASGGRSSSRHGQARRLLAIAAVLDGAWPIDMTSLMMSPENPHCGLIAKRPRNIAGRFVDPAAQTVDGLELRPLGRD